MSRVVRLDKRRVGKGNPVLVVAEISANHGRSLDKAVAMVRKARECGADAVKFQTYTPDTLTIDSGSRYFRIKHSKWGGQSLYDLYKKAYTPWKWFERLKKEAGKAGLLFFSTAFDRTAVDFLEKLGVPAHKIASFELVDLPLVEYAASKKKPLILSTGMATLREIGEAVKAARNAGAKDIILMKCVSSYPASPEEMNLRTIPDMEKKFKAPVGLSDHTLGAGAPLAAVALGARVVEKHFTLSRKRKTPDSFFSMEPEELRSLVDGVRTAERALGGICYGLTSGQRSSRVFRRSLFVVRDMDKGEVFTEMNVRSIRPADGLEPKHIAKVLGRRSRKKIKKGTPLSWDHIAQRTRT